jgi:polysaccharide biosynthesis protein PslG
VTRVVLTISTALLLLCLAAPAQARPKPLVGIGEQHPEMFSDARWQALDKPDVRYVISWDALRYKAERASTDWYLTWARNAGARVLLSFGHSRRRGRELRLPTPRQFKAQFKAIRKRYPWVTTFQTWNEANHATQPTWKKPQAAARFFDIIKGSCRTCVVSAPSVLDDGYRMIAWLKAFRRAAKRKVTIWTLHNHIDVNRNLLGAKSTTKLFLRNTRGQVWFTETGGIWNRWLLKQRTGRKMKLTRYTHKTALRAVRNIFKLQRLAPRRIKRIYYYNWYAPAEKKPRWDSGLIGPTGKERTIYRTFRAQMRKYAR